jgi:hypothetical protein
MFSSGKFENYVEVLRKNEHPWNDYAKYLGTRNLTYDEVRCKIKEIKL